MLALFFMLFLLTLFSLLSSFMVTSSLFPFLTFMGYVSAAGFGYLFEKVWKEIFPIEDKKKTVEMSIKEVDFQVLNIRTEDSDVILGVVNGNR